MTELPNIFDGSNVLELSEEQLDELCPEKREGYFGVVAASIADHDAQQAIVDARLVLRASIEKGNALQAQFDAVPGISRIDELRRTIAVQNAVRAGLPPPPAPKPSPEAAKLLESMQDNNEAESTARAALFQAEVAAKKTQAELAQAITRWLGSTKPDELGALRAHLRRQREYEAAVRRGEVTVEEKPYLSPSHLDDVLSAGSRGANVNLGYRRPQRGRTIKR